MGGVVGVCQGAVRGELQHWIGTELRKSGQLLNLDFRQLAVGDVGEGAGKAVDGAHFVESDLGIHLDPAHFAALGKESSLVTAIIEFALDELEKNMAVMRLVFLVNVFE